MFLLLPALLCGQYGTGTILGTVMDPTGAAVPNVSVTVSNEETNETRWFLTNSEGFCRFNAYRAERTRSRQPPLLLDGHAL